MLSFSERSFSKRIDVSQPADADILLQGLSEINIIEIIDNKIVKFNKSRQIKRAIKPSYSLTFEEILPSQAPKLFKWPEVLPSFL